jgi:hypothetical protein
MLKIITDITDPLLEYLKDDPVRPEISREFRVSKNQFVATLVDDKPHAIVCVSLKNLVPQSVQDLTTECDCTDTAVFYTIWSYRAGSAAKLLFDTVREIQTQHPTIQRFVTLSPKTEMAYRFHIRNGAKVLRENSDSVNYEYSTL